MAGIQIYAQLFTAESFCIKFPGKCGVCNQRCFINALDFSAKSLNYNPQYQKLCTLFSTNYNCLSCATKLKEKWLKYGFKRICFIVIQNYLRCSRKHLIMFELWKLAIFYSKKVVINYLWNKHTTIKTFIIAPASLQ